VAKRTVVAFYDEQATHHAAALTYYALMSMFPVLLLALSVLGLVGEYPRTYDAIINYLRDVVPATTLAPLDDALRAALRSKGTATTAFVVAVLVALYGGTGYLEAVRRALNAIFDVHRGRPFLKRKATDVVSLFLLLALVLVTVTLMFAGGGTVESLLGSGAATAWSLGRWPAALAIALFIFSFLYWVTPDVSQRGFRWVTPGAVMGVGLWLLASVGFSQYLSHFSSFNVTYGSFAAAIILLVWLWLTNVALLFGAVLNAEIERSRQLQEGIPESRTLDLPQRA
jgi:membrane protein